MVTAKQIRFISLIVLIGIGNSWAHAQKLYWTDLLHGKIWRANVNGTSVEAVVTGLTYPRSIALDIAAGKMYWTDSATDKIQRANLDGSQMEDLVNGLVGPRGIALDFLANKFYWTDGVHIKRSNVDGTQIETIISPGYLLLQALVLDLPAGKMYWINDDMEWGTIQRANLDGSNVESLVDAIDPWHLALDTGGGKLWWTDPSLGMILRANLDGSDVEIVLTSPGPVGIAMDLPLGKVYWLDRSFSSGGPQSLRRANVDGTDMEVLFTIDDMPTFGGLAFDPTCCRLYGDVAPPLASPGDCIVDVDDLLCVLSGFADSALCTTSDLFPCGGDGLVDVDDILAELDAFTGLYACPPPCPP